MESGSGPSKDMSSKPKVILYDFDGMIVHGTRFSDRYAKEFNIPIETMTPFFTGPFEQCIVGKADLKEELSKWFESGNIVNQEVVATIDTLRKEGVICILTTNQDKYRIAWVRDGLGLRSTFDKIFTSGEVGYKKPDPKFFEAVMSYLHEGDPSIKPDDVLFWDDRPHYAEGGKEFGLQAEVFTDFEAYKKKLLELGYTL